MATTWLRISCGIGLHLVAAAALAAADAPAGAGSPAPLPPVAPSTAPSTAPATEPAAAAGPTEADVQSVLADPLDTGELLGPAFVSQTAGISLRPPAGCKLLGRVDSNHVATWTDEKRDWSLKLSRIVFPPNEPQPLQTYKTMDGKTVNGLLDITVDQLRRQFPQGKFLRQDVTSFAGGIPVVPDPNDPRWKDAAFREQIAKNPAARNNVGIVVFRFTDGAKPHLTQKVILQQNDILYFVLTLTTPGREANDDKAPDDPGEQAAAETFRQMLDSVHVLDLAGIRRDQDERLYRTRAFFVNLSPQKLRSALVPEQWFRILRDGKDVGYTYVTEEAATGIPQPDEAMAKRLRDDKLTPQERQQLMLKPKITPGDDVLVGIRSRMTVEGLRSDQTRGPLQTDGESWLFVAADLKHEDWSKLTVLDDFKAKKKMYVDELGSSNHHVVNVKAAGSTLTVSQVGNRGRLEPVNRDLPPFYLPQAAGHLLPRILPLRDVKSYLFASFVSDAREVMFRYVDVHKPTRVTLGGVAIDAIPVFDRIGLEGSVTIHYLSPQPDGQGRYRYLGSESKDSHLTVIATDAGTIQKLWNNGANLVRPGVLTRPVPTAAAGSGGGTAVGSR